MVNIRNAILKESLRHTKTTRYKQVSEEYCLDDEFMLENSFEGVYCRVVTPCKVELKYERIKAPGAIQTLSGISVAHAVNRINWTVTNPDFEFYSYYYRLADVRQRVYGGFQLDTILPQLDEVCDSLSLTLPEERRPPSLR